MSNRVPIGGQNLLVNLNQVISTRAAYHRGLDRVVAAIEKQQDKAIGQLRKDIDDATLNAPSSQWDTFMLRANQFGLELLDRRLFAQAISFYHLMLDITKDYAHRTGNQRHTGAMLANLGAAHFFQGNVDEAVVKFFEAAESDNAMSGVPIAQSPALTLLLEEQFSKPLSNLVLSLGQLVNAGLTQADVEDLRSDLGTIQYALFAFVHLLWLQSQQIDIASNLFSQLQASSALRNLSALFEHRLKSLATVTQGNFAQVITNLYKDKQWWGQYCGMQQRTQPKPNNTTESDVRAALGLPPTNTPGDFDRSLLVAYYTRNFTAHQIAATQSFLKTCSQTTAGHILNAMMLASKA